LRGKATVVRRAALFCDDAVCDNQHRASPPASWPEKYRRPKDHGHIEPTLLHDIDIIFNDKTTNYWTNGAIRCASNWKQL